MQTARFSALAAEGTEPARLAEELWGMDGDALLEVLEGGYPIEPAALDDTEYRGVSLGLPPLAEKLSWKTFRKTFHRDPTTGTLCGWNVRLEQRGLDAPDEPMRLRDGSPKTFGPFEVCSTAGYPMPRREGRKVWCHRGLMLDYGRQPNRPPLKFLRDPIVAVRPGEVDLLLGWSYLDLGALRLPTPSFFTLERRGPLGHTAF